MEQKVMPQLSQRWLTPRITLSRKMMMIMMKFKMASICKLKMMITVQAVQC